MNKKLKATMFVAALALAGGGTWKAYDYSEANKQTLLANNLEAQAGFWDNLVEWWTSKDYICRPVDGCIWYAAATEPVKVAPGTGTHEHWWKCTTCADMTPIGGPF